MSKNRKNKTQGANTAVKGNTAGSTAAVATNNDEVKDTASKASVKETINFTSTILELKAALEKAGFIQTEVKAQRFVFEMKHNDAQARICSMTHASQKSTRKVFVVMVGVPEGLDTKAHGCVAFNERGAATSGSKPAFAIRIDKHSFQEFWNGDTDKMIAEIVAIVKEASAIRAVSMESAAKAKADKKQKKEKAADSKAKTKADAKVDANAETESEDTDPAVEESDESDDIDPNDDDLDDEDFDDEDED